MRLRVLAISLCVCFISSITTAELIRGINIDFVTIGNPGNSGDTRTAANPTGCGAVSYTFELGKYEITNGQWDDFVAAAGAPSGSSDTFWAGSNMPTTGVSWYEAAQFCNYLTTGDKSLGAYQFSGNNSNPGSFLGIDRDAAVSSYGTVYVLPTEDEWYKAAYYTGSGYSTYANGTDVAPIAGDETNYNGSIGQPWEVGDGDIEQSGTFDIMGNVWEWCETLAWGERVFRGGQFRLGSAELSSSESWTGSPLGEYDSLGFRVASIPEPATLFLLGLGSLVLRKRK